MGNPVTAQVSEGKDDRRRAILRAAVEVFARKGYHGCRIADVAREAKVAYGLVYHYFGNKEELLQSVFESGWPQFVARIREVVLGEQSLEAKVRLICDVAFEAYRVDPRAVRVLILEIARSPVGSGKVNRNEAFLEVIRLAQEMFLAAQRKGELRPQLDPMLAAAILFGALEMGLTAFVSGLLDSRDEVALERARGQIADALLSGLGMAPPARSEREWKSWKSGTRSSRAARRS